jgi:hypothetical protein
MYCPPLTIRVVDCRSFGRFTLVGTHVINSMHKYLYQPVTRKEREEKRRRELEQQTQAARDSANAYTLQQRAGILGTVGEISVHTLFSKQ